MESINLLQSRLLALVKYGQWSQNDVVNLFIALAKQYKNKTDPEFLTQMSKTLYKIEIHKINQSDLMSKTHPGQFLENVEAEIKNIIQEAKEKDLEEILEELHAQGDVEENILHDVKEIVSSVSLWYNSNPPPAAAQCNIMKETLFKLCNAVKKTQGWYPRLTQMVSWCILVLSGSSRLVQVGTGEGKSCIVAMFAAYCAINGESIDIISSSPVLAERDAKDWHLFYQELKLTVDVNTNKGGDQNLRKCYKCKVIYGTTESFAGDWLRHNFQRINVRDGRKFQRVIVDEVDSLMLDKGLEMVYLSSEMPALQSLNVILAKIWHYVNQPEHVDAERTLDLKDERALRKSLEEKIKAEIVCSVQIKQNECNIPGFQEHIKAKLGTWIDNAIRAKNMTLGHEYILHKDYVVPVDYHSTGVVQNNMKWCNGLHQFLEMKHQTRLSDMSVITNFKSNVGLFQSYKQQIYGITGTLGNQTELGTLEKVYSGIKTCKIPSFMHPKLYEEEGVVIKEETQWVKKICSVIEEQVRPREFRGPRAALVICETINRAQMLYKVLKDKVSKEKLKLYTNNNEDNSKVTDKEVKAGDVIIATNLSGRGTDLKVCREVNEAGGLFVAQTFLPLNKRVEQQAFGRTARQGSPGSAQLITCSAHSELFKCVMALETSPTVLALEQVKHISNALLPLIMQGFAAVLKSYQENPSHPNCEAMAYVLRLLLVIPVQTCPIPLEEAKKARDEMGQRRLSSFLEEDIPIILKKEQLFSDYLDMIDIIYKQDRYANCREDIVSSLHECWGMWLLLKFKESESTEKLQQQLSKDLQSAVNKLQSKQSPSSMVYHYIRSGNRLRHQRNFAESISMYTRAIEEDCCSVAIALYNRAISTLSKRDRGYIRQALADLEKAEKEVQSQMNQLKLTLNNMKIYCRAPMEEDSLLCKQFRVKHHVQELLMLNIQKAVETLQEAKGRDGDRDEDVQVTKKHVLFLVPVSDLMSLSTAMEILNEVMNLRSLGLDTIISLKIKFSIAGHVAKMFHRKVNFLRKLFSYNTRKDMSQCK